MTAEAESQSYELQANQIKEKLKAWDIKKEDVDKITAILDKTEVVDAIKKVVDSTFATETLNRLNQKSVLTEWDKAIIRLLALLYPELTIKNRLEQTDNPSGKITAILNGGGNALNFEEFKKLKPEQIKEIFRSISKGDLLAIARGIPEKKPDTLDQATFDTLKATVSITVSSMLQNGMSIENEEDITFIERFWTPETKMALDAFRKSSGEKPFDGGKKYVMKWSIIESLTTPDGKITKGIDISKINTIDLKASAEEIKKQMPQGFDKAKFWEAISSLLKSDTKIFKWIGEFLKVLLTLLGIDLAEKNDASTEKPLEAKQKRELLMKMGKANDSYDVSTFFDSKWGVVVDRKDSKFQLYLADVDKLIWPNALKKWEDGKTLVYDDTVTEKIKAYQNALKMPNPTGKLDIASVTVMLTRLDADGKLIVEAPQAQPAPAAEPLREATEAPKKHEYADLFDSMKWKSTKELLSDKALIEQIRAKIWDKTAVTQFQKELWLKYLDPNPAKRPDGKLGEETVKAFFARYPEGNIPKPQKK